MADLFRIQIESIEGTKCRVKLESIHPDQSDIPVVENIAFQIVMEAYVNFSPFPNHPWKDKMDIWSSYMFTEEFLISDQEYENYNSGNIEMPSDCNGFSFKKGRIFLIKRANHKEFVKAANNEIKEIELIEDVLIDGLTQGVLIFESYEKELLDHLKPDMNWNSAMYNRESFIRII